MRFTVATLCSEPVCWPPPADRGQAFQRQLGVSFVHGSRVRLVGGVGGLQSRKGSFGDGLPPSASPCLPLVSWRPVSFPVCVSVCGCVSVCDCASLCVCLRLLVCLFRVIGRARTQLKTVKKMVARHRAVIAAGTRDIDGYLSEGVLTEQYIVDNVEDILRCMRRCNVTLRWMILHRRTVHKKFREIILAELPSSPEILNFLLKNVSTSRGVVIVAVIGVVFAAVGRAVEAGRCDPCRRRNSSSS
jgi:hypothetical protein